jgi:hypothetical protein
LFSSFSHAVKATEIDNPAIIGNWYLGGAKEYHQPTGGTKTLLDTDGANPSETIQFKSDGSYIYKNDAGSESGQYRLKGNSLYIKSNDPRAEEDITTILQLDNTTLVIESKETTYDYDELGPGTWFYEVTYKKK